MRKLILSALVLGLGAQTAACSYNKTCYPNGVCRIEKDGVVSYEGPPEEVAKMQADEDAQKARAAELDQAYANAAKRSTEEPIRVALVGPVAATADLNVLTPAYRQMLEQELAGDPRIQLVPYGKIKMYVEAKSKDDHFGHDKKSTVPAKVDDALTHRLRDGGAEVDVVIVAHMAPKKKTGFVSGGGGSGVAEVTNVEFSGSLSSVYQFTEHQTSEVGKSTSGIAMSGVDKSGKSSTTKLKGQRDPKKDLEAIKKMADWLKSTLAEQVAPALPSMEAVAEIKKQHASDDPRAQQAEALKKLFGK